MPKAPDYSPKEDQILREHYSTIGRIGCLPLLPGRTRDSISSRARYLKIAEPPKPPKNPPMPRRRGPNPIDKSRPGWRQKAYMRGEA